MKKLSFSRKLRLAASGVDRFYLYYALLSIVITLLMATSCRRIIVDGNTSDYISDTMLSICFVISSACFNAMVAILALSLFMSRMKFFATLPITVPEIRDTAVLHIVLTHLIATVPQCAVAAAILPSMLPYWFCAQCVQLMLVMTLVMPFYFADKYMYTPSNALEDKKRRSVMKKGAFVGIGFLVLMGADYGITLSAGLRSQGEGNIALPMAISAAALIISAVSAVICRNIKSAE